MLLPSGLLCLFSLGVFHSFLFFSFFFFLINAHMATFTTLPPLCVASCRPLSHPFYPAVLRTVWVSMRLGSSSHNRARAADVAAGNATCVRVDPPLLGTVFFCFAHSAHRRALTVKSSMQFGRRLGKGHFDAHNTSECPSYPRCRPLGSSISGGGLVQIRHNRYADALLQ